MSKYKRPSKKYPENWNALRFSVFERDKYICQMCGVKCKINGGWRSPQCHHKVPVNCGGDHSWNNLMTLCKRCHTLVHQDYISKKKEKEW